MDPAGASADGKDQRCYKEGQPADDKGPQNDPQGFCGFPLSSSRNPLAFQDTIGKLDFHVVKKERGAGGMRMPLVKAGVERAQRGPCRACDEVRGGEALPVEGRRVQDAVSGGHVDTAIEDDEQHGRDVEGPTGGVDGVGDLRRVHQAVRHLFMSFGLPPKEGWNGDADRDGPDHGDHGGCVAHSPAFAVLQGICDGPVPVQSNDTEMQDGGRAACDVRRQPDVTQELAEAPGVGGGIGDADGHDQDGNQEVRHGQGANETVGWGVELPGQEDGGKHKGIGQDCGQGDDGKEHDKSNLEGLESPQVPSPWSCCGIQGSVGSPLQKTFC